MRHSRPPRLARFAGVLGLALAGGAQDAAVAWGPSTHAGLAEALLARIESDPTHRLTFLVRPRCREIFVRSSLSPDMTVNPLAGRKTDPVYNKLFHDRDLGRKMVRTARDRGDLDGTAFALGWLGHAVADRTVSGPGGIIYRDLFGLPRPSRKRLATELAAINKLSIDAVMIHDLAVPEVSPHVDETLLVEGLRRHLRARPPRGAVADPATAVPSYLRAFEWACAGMHALVTSMGANSTAFPALAAELSEDGEDGRTVPGFEESVDAMEDALVTAVGSPTTWPPAAPAAAPAGMAARALATAGAVGARVRSAAQRGSKALQRGRSAVTGALVAPALRAMKAAIGLGGPGARVTLAFFSDMVDGALTWPEVRSRVKHTALQAR
jgi:hypothetical protein